MVSLYNTESVLPDDFSGDTIKKESIVKHQDFEADKLTLVKARVQTGIFKDNRGLISRRESEFFNFKVKSTQSFQNPD